MINNKLNWINFGGIPISNNIILILYMTTWAPFFLHSGFAHMDNIITKRRSKQSHHYSYQGYKTTNHTVTLRNLANPASGTYTIARRNPPKPSGACLRNIQQRAGTLRNRNLTGAL